MSTNKRAVHVATIRKVHKGKTYVTHLLRHTYREDGKVKHLTVGNLSDLPDDLIEVIRKRLSGQPLPAESDDFKILRSLPHGHVAAVLGTLQKIGLDRLVSSKPCREAQLITALIVLRIIAPGSKLANLAGLRPETAEHSLADELQLDDIKTPEIYEALDWLLARQKRIENKLAKKHLEEGTLVLYDVSSSYYTGRPSELVKMGYSRDGKPSLPQIVYGLLCAPDGCPVAIEVFAGNTADPGERLVVCRNPLLAAERARKRKVLLAGGGEKAGRDCGRRIASATTPARPGQDRVAGRPGTQEHENAKALRADDQSGFLLVSSAGRGDCRRSGPGRALRGAHQRAWRESLVGTDGVGL